MQPEMLVRQFEDSWNWKNLQQVMYLLCMLVHVLALHLL